MGSHASGTLQYSHATWPSNVGAEHSGHLNMKGRKYVGFTVVAVGATAPTTPMPTSAEPDCEPTSCGLHECFQLMRGGYLKSSFIRLRLLLGSSHRRLETVVPCAAPEPGKCCRIARAESSPWR